MLGIKCAYCHSTLNEFDFYLERPEGKICSRCIVKHRIPVGACSHVLNTPAADDASVPEYSEQYPPLPLSHPSMERALVRELENLLP